MSDLKWEIVKCGWDHLRERWDLLASGVENTMGEAKAAIQEWVTMRDEEHTRKVLEAAGVRDD